VWSGGIFVEDVGFERHPNPYPLSTTQANLFGRVIYDRACSISAWTPLSRESFGVNDTAISRDLLWHTRTAKTLNEQPFSQWVRTELGLLLGMRTIASDSRLEPVVVESLTQALPLTLPFHTSRFTSVTAFPAIHFAPRMRGSLWKGASIILVRPSCWSGSTSDRMIAVLLLRFSWCRMYRNVMMIANQYRLYDRMDP